jgi:microcystin-dependent protein
MFNSKKLLLPISILIIAGALLFTFTSASTLDKSDQEAIEDIYEEAVALKEEINFLQNQDIPNFSDSHIGEIAMFAGTFAPRGWAFCDGQLLAISSNDALFSILGTTYGGDGRTTFGLPDLDGRVPLHVGSHDKYQLGQKGKVQGTTDATKADATHPIKYLGLNYIICMEGTYPSRN